jgi:iron complex transport system ATP-binding protein
MPHAQPHAGPTLSLDQLHFSRNGRAILSDISWQVAQRQIAAILGANGSGKSTLLRIAAGYLWPQRGTVKLLGQQYGEVALAPLRAQIGIIEATAVYPFDESMTARDVALSGYSTSLTIAYAHPTREQPQHAEHLLTQVGLASHIRQL